MLVPGTAAPPTASAVHAFRSYDWRVQGWMFPKVADIRHGIVPGARLLPQFAEMDNESYNALSRFA